MRSMKNIVLKTFEVFGMSRLKTVSANRTAFTLAEMMVVMLIVSIVLAAMAPVMTTKMKADRAAKEGTSIWHWMEDNTGIYFSTGGNQPVMIGQKKIPVGDPSALLILNRDGESHDHVLFKDRDKILGRLSFTSDNGILLGSLSASYSIGKDSVAIGSSARSDENSVAIGSSARSGGKSVAIGDSVQSGGNSVVIGSEANSILDGIAIGSKADIDTDYSNKSPNDSDAIAIGNSASAYIYKPNGYYTGSYSGGPIAIGKEAKAQQEIIGGRDIYDTSATPITQSSIAIGAKASATYGGIAIGSEYHYGRNYDHTTSAESYGVAMGVGAKAGDASVAIGALSEAKSFDTAIGRGALALGENSTAIGVEAKALANNSTAIGAGAESIYENQITLGTADSTVYIPGNLVVHGSVALAAGEGSVLLTRVYYQDRDGNGKVHSGAGNSRISLAVSEDWNGDDDNWEDCWDKTGGGFTKIITIGPYSYQSSGVEEHAGTLTSSDRRLKYVGKESKDGLDKIRQLKIFNYTFKKDPSKEPRVGVIAQDLQKVFPNAVKKGKDGFLTIRMEDMFYAMVNAIKELDMKVTEILRQVQNNKKEIQALKNENRELKARIEKLEAKIK